MKDNTRIKESLSELWFNIKHFFVSLWEALLGFFLMSSKIHRQEKRRRDTDEKMYFKEQSKKKMMKWVLKERQLVKRLYKHPAIPKGQEENMIVYNYIQSVILSVNPQQTLEQVVGDFYATIHPYFHIYYYAWKDLQKALQSGDTANYMNSNKKKLLQKYARVPDLKEQAKVVMKIKTDTVKEIRRQEAELRRSRKKADEMIDANLVKARKEILEGRIEKDKQLLEAMMETEKQQRERDAAGQKQKQKKTKKNSKS